MSSQVICVSMRSINSRSAGAENPESQGECSVQESAYPTCIHSQLALNDSGLHFHRELGDKHIAESLWQLRLPKSPVYSVPQSLNTDADV
jgi:hypothetical protein